MSQGGFNLLSAYGSGHLLLHDADRLLARLHGTASPLDVERLKLAREELLTKLLKSARTMDAVEREVENAFGRLRVELIRARRAATGEENEVRRTAGQAESRRRSHGDL